MRKNRNPEIIGLVFISGVLVGLLLLLGLTFVVESITNHRPTMIEEFMEPQGPLPTYPPTWTPTITFTPTVDEIEVTPTSTKVVPISTATPTAVPLEIE